MGYPQPQGMGYPGAGYGQYEFNDYENSIVAKTAGRARLWGIISIVIGALYTLSGFLFFLSPGLITNFVTGIIGIVIGVVFLGVGSSLNSVVSSQGNDVEHMMNALNKMSTAFMIQIITTIVGVILGGIFMVLGILLVAAAAASGP